MGGVRLPKKQRRTNDVTNLTTAMRQHYAGDPGGALRYYVQTLQQDINNPTALYFAALAKDQLGHDRTTAIPYMLKALALLTQQQARSELIADAFFNLGKFYLSGGDEAKAFTALLAALEHNENHTESLVGIGDHLYALGDREAAVASWTRAIQIPPRCPEAAHYRSFIRLRCGDPDGWSDFEARWACKMFEHQYGRPEYAQIPLWWDQDLTGKRIIVHGEQGHGDVIQCVRYLPLLRDKGATVILEAHKPLVRLMRESFPWLGVFERETTYPGLVDFQIPSFSLPHRFAGANPNAPYLKPDCTPIGWMDPEEAEALEGAPLRVALAWRGSKTHSNDRNRSCPVEHLAPLWDVPNVEYVSLQVGDAADEANGTPMERADRQIKDFADTADVIAACDLTISVDTAVAHLAGALGARVWLMTPVLSEWRWGIEEPTTPLYPSMRIFRQTSLHDWPSVVEQVGAALVEMARSPEVCEER